MSGDAAVASPAAAVPSGPLLELCGVSKSFGERTILRDLSWSLAPGECAVILGPSGGGKSVFLSLLLGLRTPDEGEILRGGGLDADFFSRAAVMFQEDALLDDRTIGANLAIALRERVNVFSGPFGDETAAAVDRALTDVRLDPATVRDVLPSQLSGGMRRRVALARALIRNPALLIADEPTTGLDGETSRVVYDLMGENIRARGMSAVIITHDPACAARLGRPTWYFTPLEGRLRRFPDPEHDTDPDARRRAIEDWLGAIRAETAASGAGGSGRTPEANAASIPTRGRSSSLHDGLESLGRAVLFSRHMFRVPDPALLLREFRRWGVESLPLVILIFFLLGVVMEIQTESAISEVGFSNRLPELLALAMPRLAAIITGFLLAGRCGSAVTAQAGWMNLSGQSRALRTMKIDPDRELFPPILWSWVLAAPLLAWTGMITAWAAAWGMLKLRLTSAEITATYFLNGLMKHVDHVALVIVPVKCVIIAAGMAAIAWSCGGGERRSASEVSSAITRGLVLSFIWLTVTDAVVSLIAE